MKLLEFRDANNYLLGLDIARQWETCMTTFLVSPTVTWPRRNRCLFTTWIN